MENKIVLGVYCLIEDDDKILLMEDVGKPGWKLPGGKANSYEKIVDVAKREIKEESDLEIEPVSIVAIEEYIKKGSEHRIRIFLKARLLGGTVKLAVGEVNKFIWVTKDDLLKMSEAEFFKDFVYDATRNYLSSNDFPLDSFLITTERETVNL